MPGTIHKSRTLFFREAGGEAENGERGYELTLSMSANRTPIIRSKTTGKWFTLSWADMIDLAIAAGIDKKEAPDAKAD